MWGQHLLRASIVQNFCCRCSALRIPFIFVSIKFPLSTFGLKAFVGRISQLLSTPFIRVAGFWVGGEMAINQVKGKGDEMSGLSYVQVSALSFIYSLSGLYQRFTSLPYSMISEGEFFLCHLDTGKWMQANRQGGHLFITSTSKFR